MARPTPVMLDPAAKVEDELNRLAAIADSPFEHAMRRAHARVLAGKLARDVARTPLATKETELRAERAARKKTEDDLAAERAKKVSRGQG